MVPLIIYHSRTGNTRRIAEAIANCLSADLRSTDEVTIQDFAGRDLIGIGSGIYWGCADRQTLALAANIPPDCKAFMFITSGLGWSFMRRMYWHYIRKEFASHGKELYGEWDCRGFDQHPSSKWMGISRIHPDDADINSAITFTKNLILSLADSKP